MKIPIEVAGVDIDPETMPELARIAATNPEGLAAQLESLAKAGGSDVQTAATNLENDLEHG